MYYCYIRIEVRCHYPMTAPAKEIPQTKPLSLTLSHEGRVQQGIFTYLFNF